MPTIVVVQGVSRGNYLRLEPRVLVIGRDERCDMQVLDEKVSRRHMEIAPSGNDFVACDLSANGVFINGRRIKGHERLSEDDVITLGDSELIFTTRDMHDQQAAISFAAHGQSSKRTMESKEPG